MLGACDFAGWHDERQIFRILNACFVVHWIMAATSLLLQFLFPLRGVTHHVGNEQLWYRARIRALSVPLQISMGCLKPKLHGTPFQRRLDAPSIYAFHVADVFHFSQILSDPDCLTM
eukprot:s1624_g2.t1